MPRNPVQAEAIPLVLILMLDALMWTRIVRMPPSAERTGHLIAAVFGAIACVVMAGFLVLTWIGV